MNALIKELLYKDVSKMNTACDWILRLSVRYRLPETTRQADQMVRKLKKESAVEND